MVEKAGLEFEESPVVNGNELSFRIGQKYFISASRRQFLSLPQTSKSHIKEKLYHSLEIFKKLYELHTGKDIFVIPISGKPLFAILQRECKYILIKFLNW